MFAFLLFKWILAPVRSFVLRHLVIADLYVQRQTDVIEGDEDVKHKKEDIREK